MGFQSSAARTAPRRALARGALAAAIAGVCFLLIADRLGEFDRSAILPTLAAFAWWQWAGAALATALSFAALGQYDTLFHRWLGTGITHRRGVFAGMSAIAIAQMAGFGLVTGTLARWRGLPELSMRDAFRLTNYVSFSFMAGLGLLATLSVSLVTLGTAHTALSGLVVVLTAAVLVIRLSLHPPKWLPFAIPPLGLILRQMILTAIDVAFAAMALFIFLPDPTVLGPALLFTVFLLSLGAGLLSGVPGGVGPFELCLITLLPAVPAEDLITAVLAYRLVYYGLPAALGVIWVLTSRPAPTRPNLARPAKPVAVRAETEALARQKGHGLVECGGAILHLAPATQTLVAMGDPVPEHALTPTTLHHLSQDAKARGLFPAFYKIGARSAARLRRHGWSVLRISEEATLDIAAFSTDGAKCRQLRRKLRRAEQAGVTVEEHHRLPVKDMARVSASWVERNGDERGFSMGMFNPGTLHSQRCFLAYRDGRLVAFASFHHTPDEWALDLMRSAEGACDGTMHSLIVAAAEAAKKAGAKAMSLAAVPLEQPGRLLRLVQDMDGLRQFKLTFAPRLHPLYLAAPTRVHLALAGADILIRIQSPTAPDPDAALQKTQRRLSETAVVSLAIPSHIHSNIETHRMRE